MQKAKLKINNKANQDSQDVQGGQKLFIPSKLTILSNLSTLNALNEKGEISA